MYLNKKEIERNVSWLKPHDVQNRRRMGVVAKIGSESIVVKVNKDEKLVSSQIKIGLPIILFLPPLLLYIYM